jgi:hypothetical protein
MAVSGAVVFGWFMGVFPVFLPPDGSITFSATVLAGLATDCKRACGGGEQAHNLMIRVHRVKMIMALGMMMLEIAGTISLFLGNAHPLTDVARTLAPAFTSMIFIYTYYAE